MKTGSIPAIAITEIFTSTSILLQELQCVKVKKLRMSEKTGEKNTL